MLSQIALQMMLNLDIQYSWACERIEVLLLLFFFSFAN